jgi:hypothetical protein
MFNVFSVITTECIISNDHRICILIIFSSEYTNNHAIYIYVSTHTVLDFTQSHGNTRDILQVYATLNAHDDSSTAASDALKTT